MNTNEDTPTTKGCGIAAVSIITWVVAICALTGISIISGGAFLVLLFGICVAGLVLKLVYSKKNHTSSTNLSGTRGNVTYSRSIPEIPSSSSVSGNSSSSYTTLCYETLFSIESLQYAFERDSDLMENINHHIAGLESIDNAPFAHHRHNNRVSFFIMHDLIRCYQRLGHSIAANGKEKLPLIMYITALTTPPDSYNLGGQITLPVSAHRFASSMLSNIAGLTCDAIKGDYDFFLGIILRNYDSKLHREYISLLYRFSILVAKANGVISTREQKWLSGLLSDNGIPADFDVPVQGSTTGHTTNRQSNIEKLDNLTGLSEVKDEVRNLRNLIKVNLQRKKQGLKTSTTSYHYVFTGNPGTGKTTVARIIADIYREFGIIKKGHLIETDRSGLVAEYVGQTAVKTNKVIDSALDGVLFIDEAYSLVNGDRMDFGNEAISTLLKRMEDNRDRLIVILAGYGDEMKQFIDSNPGLQSRFNRYIHFKDYSSDELFKIICSNFSQHDFTLTSEASQKLASLLNKAVEQKDRNFGNARYTRNLFEKILERQATRLIENDTLSKNQLQTISIEDIPD